MTTKPGMMLLGKLTIDNHGSGYLGWVGVSMYKAVRGQNLPTFKPLQFC